MSGKKHIADIAKIMEMAIGRGRAKKTLVGSRTLKSKQWSSINEGNNHRHNLYLEVRIKINEEEKSTSCLKNVMMLMSIDIILSMSTEAGELWKSTLVCKITLVCIGNVLTSRVSMKSMKGKIELSADRSSRILLFGKNLTMRRHQINPNESRILSTKNI